MKHNAISFLKNHLWLISVLFFLGLSACEDEASCVSNNTNLIGITFYEIDTNNTATALPVRINSIKTDQGATVYADDQAISDVVLPLNPGANQVTFLFEQDTATDVLQVSYNREQLLISPECGVDQRFYGLGVTQQTFDSLRVRLTDLEKSQENNIAIYLCQYDFIDTVALRFYTIEPTTQQARADTIWLSSVVDDRGNILASEDSLSALAIPLAPEARQTTLLISRYLTDTTIQQDTLVLFYRNREIQIAQCFPQLLYKLDSARFTFDSLSFVNKTLSRNNAENIRVFF